MTEKGEAAEKKSVYKEILREEKTLGFSLLTTLLFFLFGAKWVGELDNSLWFAFISVWLFVVILFSAFSIVRHAESLAELLGEPLGTLILTLSVIGIEVSMISAVMLTGEDKPSLARDTMFAVVMIVLNGMVGISLLLGGWRHFEQDYNINGANSFLALIVPLSVLGLVLPSFTTTTANPTFSPFQAVFITLMSIGLYVVFLFIQNRRHREYFISTDAGRETAHHDFTIRSVPHHAAFLVAYLLPLVFLAKKLAVPVDYGTQKFGAPPALGGFLVAVLILSPEAMSAVKAAVRNDLQRSINISLGSVLATIGLTIPAVLTIGLLTGKTVVLGLNAADTVLLVLSLILSTLTFTHERTNILLGAVHLLLFLAYLMLIFEG
ncbi:MAG: calcium:proton antiporter [Acidobacteria bacterium]|nr:calcium:proton antiporter [Acidobacteriota bacterium]